MDIKYRKFTYEDIPKLIDLRKKQLKDEGASETCDITNPLKEYYETHIINMAFVGYVAASADIIVATSGLSFTTKPPWYGNLTGKI